MRTSRLVAGTLTAGLLGLTPIAIAAPSHAVVDNWTTTTTAVPSATEVEYGDKISIGADVAGSDGGNTYDGTSTLYALTAGSATWVPVTTVQASYSFYDVKPTINTSYKVVYSGYTDPDVTYGDNYAASESAPFTVSVARKITAPSSGFVLRGKVTPDYAKKKIVIKVSRKANKGYKSFKTIKTDRRGKYRVVLPQRRGTWYWSVTVKADAKYLGNGYVWRTTVY